MSELVLRGINGGNPLGFLAALGTLRTASRIWADKVRMSWGVHDGAWRPVLQTDVPIEASELTEKLSETLKGMSGHPAFAFAKNLTVSFSRFRSESLNAMKASEMKDRVYADFLAAFGSDAVSDDKNNKKGKIQNSYFGFLRGAGRQNFFVTILQLINDTDNNHIDKTLFSSWLYDDPIKNHTMRWDPIDDIRHALQWVKPEEDPSRKISGCMWGANRLAIEALPLLPTVPKKRRLETTGFSQNKERDIVWTWPIWEPNIPVETVRSLLALDSLQVPTPDRNRLQRMGVVEIFRCSRLRNGNFINFSLALPAQGEISPSNKPIISISSQA